MERYSISLVIRKIQFKITTGHHCLSNGMAQIKDFPVLVRMWSNETLTHWGVNEIGKANVGNYL